MANRCELRLLFSGSARRDPGYQVAWRRLPGLLVEWADGGAWRIELDGGQVRTLPAGTLLLLAPERRHRMTALAPAFTSHWLVIQVTVDGVPMLTGAELPPTLAGAQALRLARRILQPAGDLAGVVRQGADLHLLLGELLTAVPPQPLPLPRAGRIAEVVAAIDERLAEPLTRRDLARLAGLSPTRFHAVFAAATGLAPMAWLRRARLRRARELLGAGDLPIGAIASRCGFASPYHFSRLFHRCEGCTPSAWRAGVQHGG